MTTEARAEREAMFYAALCAKGVSDHVATSVASLWVEAEDPATPGDRLRILAECQYDVQAPARQAARRNPSLPSAAIRHYVLQGDLDVWSNPGLSLAAMLDPGDWSLIGAERALEKMLHGETWGAVRKSYADLPSLARLLESAVRWRTHQNMQVTRWQEALDAILAFVRSGSGQGSPPAAEPPLASPVQPPL